MRRTGKWVIGSLVAVVLLVLLFLFRDYGERRFDPGIPEAPVQGDEGD
jgi:hypothetical protein